MTTTALILLALLQGIHAYRDYIKWKQLLTEIEILKLRSEDKEL